MSLLFFPNSILRSFVVVFDCCLFSIHFSNRVWYEKMMKDTSHHTIIEYTIPLWISVAVSLSMFFQARLLAPENPDNRATFLVYAATENNAAALPNPWKPRLFSTYLAGLMMKAILHVENSATMLSENDVFELGVALWAASWLFLVNTTFVFAFRDRSLFYILGTFAAVSFGYMPGIVLRIFPWDMPALFFYTLLVVTSRRLPAYGFLVLIPLATGFKETAILLSITLFFSDKMKGKKMLMAFILVMLLSVFVKILLGVATGTPHAFFSMHSSAQLLRYNVISLVRPNPYFPPPVFINAGLLLAFLLLPIVNRRMLILKVICLLFIIGTFTFGAIVEYRIWFEMIPISLCGLEMCLFRHSKGKYLVPL